MIRQLRPAVSAVLVFTIMCGLVFPLVITVLARVVFPWQANGSLVHRNGTVIGSVLIGQSFTSPKYFHPRRSAAGAGYDATASGGTNLGPNSDKLINGVHQKLRNGQDDPSNFDGVKDIVAAYRTENGLVPNAQLPADAVTRSGSGLDPHISPANAMLQTARVAEARGLTATEVQTIVAVNTEGRTLGLFGEPRVNVLKLNLALDGKR